MKKIIILLLIAISTFTVYSQKGAIVIKIDSKENVPKFEKELSGDKLNIKSKIPGLTETLKKYNVYMFKQLYPSSKNPELLKYYFLQADGHKRLIQEIKELHSDKIPYLREFQEPKPLYSPNDYNFTVTYCNDGCREVGLSYLDLINAPEVWEITKGDPNLIIGMYDKHLYVEHEDLDGKIFKVYDDNTRVPVDPNTDHGTWVAGVLAAETDNSTGISSVSFNCRLAKTSETIAHPTGKDDLLTMAQEGVKVINISMVWQDEEDHRLLINELIQDYGVTVVAAAGNINSEEYVYPASYDDVISVTSVGHEFDRGTVFNDRKFNWKDVHKNYIDPDLPSYTHTHNDKVDICAPGYNILTLSHPDYYTDGRLYHIRNGTSFAAPQVAGVCALMHSINPGITPSEVENIIKSTAVDIESIPENSDYVGKLGAGRINAFEAVKEAGTTYLTCFQSTKSISAGYGFKLNDVTINDNADVILTARKEVVINGTFEMPVGSTFEMAIDANAVTIGKQVL